MTTVAINLTTNIKTKRKTRKKELKKLEKLAKLHAQQTMINECTEKDTKIADDDDNGDNDDDVGDENKKQNEDEESTTNRGRSNSNSNSSSQDSQQSVLKRVKTQELFDMLQNDEAIARNVHGRSNSHIKSDSDLTGNTMFGNTLRHGMNVDAALAEFAAKTELEMAAKRQENNDVDDKDHGMTIDDLIKHAKIQSTLVSETSIGNQIRYNDQDDSKMVDNENGMIIKQESNVEEMIAAKMELLDEIRHRLFDRFFKYVCYICTDV